MANGRKACALLAVGVLALACGGEEEPKPSGAPMARADVEPAEERSENNAPVVERVVLNPPRPLPGHRIDARVEASDPDGDPIRLTLEWRHGGRTISKGSKTNVAPDGLEKNQEIEVIVTATDGRDESAPVRVTALVGNQAPLISAIALAPDGEVSPGQEVTAVPQGLDPDGDELEYEFEWLLNGEVVSGADDASFATASLERGDRLKARARVGDGEEWSPFAETQELQLANRPPRIVGVPPIESVAGGIRAQLEAEDPDGDRSFRFRVVEGPRGLSVDPITGQLTWKPALGTRGTQVVEIGVADSFGAESALRFELDVSTPEDQKVAPPAKADPADGAAGEGDDEAEAEADAEVEADAEDEAVDEVAAEEPEEAADE